MGLLLQDMDYIVSTTMTIERERGIEEPWSIRDASAKGKRKVSQSSSSLRKKSKASSSRGFQG